MWACFTESGFFATLWVRGDPGVVPCSGVLVGVLGILELNIVARRIRVVAGFMREGASNPGTE
jgi:hypothetical protein